MNEMDKKLIGVVAYCDTAEYWKKLFGEYLDVWNVPIGRIYHSAERSINDLVRLLSDKKYKFLYFIVYDGYRDFEEATGINMLDWYEDKKIKKMSFEEYCKFIEKRCVEVNFDLSKFNISRWGVNRQRDE